MLGVEVETGAGVAELDAESALVVSAEAGEFVGEVAELAESLFGIFHGSQGVDVEGEFGGNDVGDVFGDGDASAAGIEAQVGRLLGGPAGLFAEELVALPVYVTAVAPLGEVLLADGVAAELFGDEFLDFGELVEPFENGFGEFAVFEALANLLADCFWQASDFAGAGVHKV